MLKIQDLNASFCQVTNRFELELYLDKPIKWAEFQMNFSAVFSGSNDRNDCDSYSTIVKYLQSVGQRHPLTLISVVGGSFFLDLVNDVEFKSVILFDSNVAEFTKISSAFNYLNEDPLQDPFEALERDYTNDATSLMPNGPKSSVTWKVEQDSFWQFEDVKDSIFPFILTKEKFPQYSWKVSDIDRQLVLERLKSALIVNVFPEFPRIDFSDESRQDLVVIFASNVPDNVFTSEFIRERLDGIAGSITLRTCDGRSNESALDPHAYWEATARSLKIGKSHQIWPDEDADLLGGIYDKTMHTSGMVGSEIPQGTETVLFHIVFGKSTEGLESRHQKFSSSLKKIPKSVKRVVVAEFRPEGEVSANNFFPTTEVLRDFLCSYVPFSYKETIGSPGQSDLMRNLFFVFDKT